MTSLRQWWTHVSLFRHELADELGGRGAEYNAFAVGYLVAAGLLAYRLGELYALLAVLLVVFALATVGLAVVHRHLSRQHYGPYPDSARLSGEQVSGQPVAVYIEVVDEVQAFLADSPPDGVRTAAQALARTGQRTAITAVPDSPADRTADSGQAVRVQVADR